LLFFGFGVGVAVMIVLLSIGEAMLSQARNEKLVGGGTITVLPEGLDVEVMKTGGIGGLFFSIDHASFLYRQVLASPRYNGEIAAVAPQIEGRLLYVGTADGQEFPVHASGDIPSATTAVGAAPEIVAGKWENDASDRRWAAPTAFELRN
jgi:ABC-type antimicrobial peptide transport system permease subunit